MKFISRPEELVLLAIWKLGSVSYGVSIREMLTEMTGKYWSIGSVYVPLDRLEQKGLVKTYKGNATAERGGKAKRYYELTEFGLKHLGEIQKMNQELWRDIPNLNTGKQ